MRFPPETYDRVLRRLVLGGTENGEPVAGNPNLLVPWFLMAAHAYEELDDPFLTDGGWDWLCAELDRRWDAIEHRHKHLIDRAALSTGTASYLVGKIPSYVQGAARHLLRDYDDPSQIGCRAARPLPGPDISDLLGTIEKMNQDIADLIGIPKATLEDLL